MKAQDRILIVGGTGFVGFTLAKALSSDYDVTITYSQSFTPIEGVRAVYAPDLDKADSAKALVTKLEPQFVIYCAGSNDHRFYEIDANSRVSQISHSAVASSVMTASDIFKAKFIFISADMVFSGAGGNFHENDTPMPITTIGKSKLGGENYLRGRCLNHVIIRPAPLLGRGTLEHPSWVDQLREKLIRGKPIQAEGKLIRNPTHISQLVQAIQAVIKNDVRNETLHIGGLTRISEFELYRLLAKKLNLNPKKIEQTDTQSQASSSDYSLNCTESLQHVSLGLLTIEESLDLLSL